MEEIVADKKVENDGQIIENQKEKNSYKDQDDPCGAIRN